MVRMLAMMGLRKKDPVKKLLVVRVDEIGDFMLWRPFFTELLDCFPGYEYHFCGNQSWKTLFNNFDVTPVTFSYWMDKTRFKKDMTYRYQFLRHIHRQGYTAVVNPTFSRDKRYDDSVVRAAKAKDTWGMVANKEAVRGYEYGYDRHLYNHLFDHPERPLFEFYRNKLFSGFLRGAASNVGDTKLDLERLPALDIVLPEKYVVVFPGSRSAARIWPTENFVRVAGFLYEHHGLTAVVCGTNADAAYTEAFCAVYHYPALDLTGKTSLVQMLTVLKNADCLLSVDTGSVHLAAAVGCPVFGIFNGSQYRRFAPYPRELAPSFYAIYPDEVEAELKNETLVKQKYEFVVRVPYSLVKPEKVMLAIYAHFKK